MSLPSEILSEQHCDDSTVEGLQFFNVFPKSHNFSDAGRSLVVSPP